MATITQITLQVFSGTTASGTQVGSNIVVQGSPSTVTLDNTTLGAYLTAGEQYCVRAKCINDEQYETPYTNVYPFKTLIYAEIITLDGGNGKLYPELSFTYNNQVLTVQECGVYVSTNASGTNSQKIAANDQQEAEQGWEITGLTENTTYYAIPYVIDGDGREYKGEWANAETASTGSTETIAITSVTNVTPTSATVNLSYGNGGAVVNPNQQQ